MPVIDQEIGDGYALYHSDCMEMMPQMPSESVGLAIYSPPFPELYQYSDNPRDMCNCVSYQEAIEQYRFVVRELARLTKPGRLNCVHATDLKRGILYQHDFPGDIIRVHEAEGMHYFCRVTIWKDAWDFARRTRMKTLMHKTIVEDSSKSRLAPADYLLVFKKAGENADPITHEDGFREYAGSNPVPPELLKAFANYSGDQRKNSLSHWIYRQYASPVWMDIRRGRTLPYEGAKEDAEERHVCLARDSLTLTRERGYVPIQDVQVGESVLTHQGRWKPVVSKRMNGFKETVRLKAQGVPCLRLTSDHRLWCRDGVGPGRWEGMPGSNLHPRKWASRNSPSWISAGEAKGHYVNLPLPPIEYSPLSENDWWVIGRWLGDGHLDSRGYPHISCSVKEASSLAVALGRRAGHTRQTNRSTVSIALKDAVPVSGVAGGRRTTAFTEMLKKCGRGAEGKKLPPEAYALEPTKAEALLAGYLSADGHFVARHQRWTASSVSRPLLLGMAMLAQRSRGVAASVYAGRPPGQQIIEGRCCNTLQDWVLSIPPQNISGMLLDDGAWKKVRDVQPVGTKEVWDLQVEEDESFVAEGCVVHNCPLQLDVIERCLALWSKPGDTVLTPFMGVGSEVVGALSMGRKAVGAELKGTYYRQAVRNVTQTAKNLAAAEAERKAQERAAKEGRVGMFASATPEPEPEAIMESDSEELLECGHPASQVAKNIGCIACDCGAKPRKSRKEKTR